MIELQTLWPFPAAQVRSLCGEAHTVLVVEMNMGQYVREILRLLPGKQIDFFGQMNGNLITPAQIREVI